MPRQMAPLYFVGKEQENRVQGAGWLEGEPKTPGTEHAASMQRGRTEHAPSTIKERRLGTRLRSSNHHFSTNQNVDFT